MKSEEVFKSCMMKNFGQEVESKVTTIEERKSQRNKIPNLIVEMKEKRVDIQREFLLFSLFLSQK